MSLITGPSLCGKIVKTAIIALVIMLCLPVEAMARTITTYEDDGKESVPMDMDAAGSMANATYIDWNYTAMPLDAKLNITPGPHTTGGKDYPLAPQVNIGGVGDPEWAYVGTGYGNFGLQNTFSDNASFITKDFQRAGAIKNSVLIPKGATIKSASVAVAGQAGAGRYTDDIVGSVTGNRVAYGKSYNTIFISTPTAGLIAKDLQDGSVRRFGTFSEPSIGTNAPGAILFDDATGLLFIAASTFLVILNFSTMEVVDILSTTSALNTMTNSLYSMDYDHVTGILVIGEQQWCTIINYTSRTRIGSVQVSTTWSDTMSTVDYDRSTNMVWAGYQNGVAGIDIATLSVTRRYSQVTSPPIGANVVKDVQYDPVSGRLFVGTSAAWGNPGLDIINVQAGTTYLYMNAGTTPALPFAGCTVVDYNPLTGILYAGTPMGAVGINVGAKTIAASYNPGSTPSIRQWQVNDMVLAPSPGHLVILNADWVQIINVTSGTKPVELSVQGDIPTLPGTPASGHVTDAKHNRVLIYYSWQVSILNLTTNSIDANISTTNILAGHTCAVVHRMIYDETTDLIFLSCRNGGQIYLGVYNLTTMSVRRYYDNSTTPSIMTFPWGTGEIYFMDYDPASDRLVLSHYQRGVMIINLTTNATQLINDVSAPAKLLSLSTYGVDMDFKNDRLIVGCTAYGVSIINLSDGSSVEFNASSTPAIATAVVGAVLYKPETQMLTAVTWGVGIDVFNVTTKTLVKRYNATSSPLPIGQVYNLIEDPVTGVVSGPGNNGSMVLNPVTGLIKNWYSLTTIPPLLQTAVSSADRVGALDWDVLNEANSFQIVKPSPLPADLELRINGELVWEQLGSFSGGGSMGIGAAVTRALASGRCRELPPDAFGNVLVEVPIQLTTQHAGIVNLSNISIEYSITITTEDLTAPLWDFLNDTRPSWDGRIPINVSMASAGKLTLAGLNVVIDEAPFFDPFPTNLWVLENSINTRVLDLWTYVHDDNDMDADLTYTVTPLANGTHFVTGLLENKWLLIDTASPAEAKNWTGELKVRFSAKDTRGIQNVSYDLTVRVEPLQEIYILSSPPTTATEDTMYIYEMKAESHRGLPLNFSLDKAPTRMAINATSGILTWSPGNGDVGAHDISIKVTDGTRSASQDYVLSVEPVNDAPTVKQAYFEVTVYEGTPFGMDLAPEIMDVDDGPANLTLTVASSFVTIEGLELTFLYPRFSRMSGENATVTVSDGKASATISILTHVIGVFWVDPLADIALSEGTPLSVDIAPGIHDPAAKVLTVTTDSSHVTVNGTTLKYSYPVGSGILEENVTIKVSDGTAVNDTSVRVKVTITPVFPTVAIIAPAPGWSAPGKFKATGTASISAGTISKVEIKIDDGDWKVASGTDVWELDIDIAGMTTGVHYIYVKASAGDATSEVATSRFVLEPGGTKEVNTAGSLMLGLAIGLILAIILAIVMYMVGRKGAKGGDEEGRMAAKGGKRAYSEDVEEEEGQDDEGYDDEGNDRSGGNASRQEEAEGEAGHYYNEKEGEQGAADGGEHGHDDQDQDNNMGEDDGYGGEAFGDAPSKRRR